MRSAGSKRFGLLESAIARPFQVFDDKDLYPTPFEKAAALGESLITNHPFIDGNKRTGMASMYGLLIEYNIHLTSSDDELYKLIIEISTGSARFEQIVDWLKANSSKL